MRVYCAGPYTSNPNKNTRIAIQVGAKLLAMGHHPFVPHAKSHLWDIVDDSMTWEKWMEYDLVWLAQCEALIRIPGESKGADLEVREARRLGIPVYYGLAQFVHHLG